jgi:cytochrome o ubiquinol oxidase subunit 2
MRRRTVFAVCASLLALGVLVVAFILSRDNVAVLRPAGIIASQQRHLLAFAALLSLVVILPVFILTFFIAFRYRESNTHARYTPEWDHHPLLEILWWGIPIAIILVLSVVTWRSSHSLDPSRPIVSSQPALTIEVIALQWKWLFIYPEQHIATVNYVQLPVNRPVNFHITADAPMNSFWIPRLGGQIYAMSGMTTQLHLRADQPGEYNGSSANLSGSGFADMKFIAQASSDADFASWVHRSQLSQDELTNDAYSRLARPSKATAPYRYTINDTTLYDRVVMKYMMPIPGMTP